MKEDEEALKKWYARMEQRAAEREALKEALKDEMSRKKEYNHGTVINPWVMSALTMAALGGSRMNKFRKF